MTLKRILPFLLITILATGCFRQARDTFEPVDSTGGTIPITQDAQTAPEDAEPTGDVILIDPSGSTDDATPTTFIIQPETNTPRPQIVEPETDTETGVDATPTIIIIQSTAAPTSVVPPTDDNAAALSTATPAQTFITPDVDLELIEPTATETPPVTATPLETSPVDTSETIVDENPLTICEYEVVGGDTLFGIAIRNDVSLAELREVNGLEGDFIDVGQILILPGCNDDGTLRPTSTPRPTNTPRPDGEFIHRVASGDTLYDLAIRYGTTITRIREANGLSNNVIRPGQELIIPDQEVEESSNSSNSSGTGTTGANNVPTATPIP